MATEVQVAVGIVGSHRLHDFLNALSLLLLLLLLTASANDYGLTCKFAESSSQHAAEGGSEEVSWDVLHLGNITLDYCDYHIVGNAHLGVKNSA